MWSLLALVFLSLLSCCIASREDFYKILGVPKDAKQKEIQRAFRKEGGKWHPDRAPEGKKEEYHKQFSKITEVLGDAEKRKQYDIEQQSSLRGFGGTGGFDFNFGDLFGSGSRNAGPRTGGMGSIFEQMFGGMGGNNVKFNSNFGAGTSCVTTRMCDARGCRTETRCS